MNDTQENIPAADLVAAFDDWDADGVVSVWDGKVKWFRPVTEVDVIEDVVLLTCTQGMGRPVLLAVSPTEELQVVRS